MIVTMDGLTLGPQTDEDGRQNFQPLAPNMEAMWHSEAVDIAQN